MNRSGQIELHNHSDMLDPSMFMPNHHRLYKENNAVDTIGLEALSNEIENQINVVKNISSVSKELTPKKKTDFIYYSADLKANNGIYDTIQYNSNKDLNIADYAKNLKSVGNNIYDLKNQKQKITNSEPTNR